MPLRANAALEGTQEYGLVYAIATVPVSISKPISVSRLFDCYLAGDNVGRVFGFSSIVSTEPATVLVHAGSAVLACSSKSLGEVLPIQEDFFSITFIVDFQHRTVVLE